ncbi:hypothetical protein RY831_31920 [Noviherbaspirillum sp. CPCC 100848]|uniref:Uncharacterized protein n=1 Tax=Noviherbaspirillum album TaxID=3080276 RepID=A0ABU6JKE1_9BURK|nr:hypothetical protein [Noviherbaspirillum sp. CPCC 100848]MEC4723732.1 hypothetical protein [Noviherbaspirillum sp. CPCC 100848]
MPRKPEPAAAPAVIKWTQEEWELIAKRLLDVKGHDLLQSAQLDEVKAKDVFLAQDALPEGRHRKLISISQGFQAIRQRLHGILQKFNSTTSQEDLFAGAPQSNAPAAEPSAKTTVRQKRKSEHGNANETLSDSVPVHAQQIDNPTHEIAGETKPVLAPVEQLSRKEPLPAASQPQTEARLNEPKPAPRSDRSNQNNRASRPVQTPSPVATGDFIELARPFVSMVCEELANALVTRLMAHGGSQAATSLLQSALNGARHSTARQQRQPNTPSYVSPASRDESFAAMEHSLPTAQASDDHDEDHDEADVQPLFDPKLPPSANSAFKPMVALIGTSTHDFEDLQRYYPQLELKVVPLEDLRTAPSLRSCQRMIGLREDIPAPADEYLRKTFRNRYLRVIGGVSQVREQLNAWLASPGTMNDQPRWPRKQGNAGGKGQGAGYPKKRQFRRPKTTP